MAETVCFPVFFIYFPSKIHTGNCGNHHSSANLVFICYCSNFIAKNRTASVECIYTIEEFVLLYTYSLRHLNLPKILKTSVRIRFLCRLCCRYLLNQLSSLQSNTSEGFDCSFISFKCIRNVD